ncbi:MAG TPA: class I SAM-dependent methyltransferase [Rubrobacter sp.]|nr:class I SAM-dependent methyltransferase [Rubrobacter sp.]
MANDRNRLRTTFDEAAVLYDEVRPGYPDQLFDDVVSLSGIPLEGRILEIGCGTGQATLPFARRGYRILCIELGENMAALARRNLELYPQVHVRTGDFEQVSLQERAFDLAISATAFHWLDPAVAYPKVARSLVPGGAISLFWNVHVHSDAGEGFFEAAQRIYEREAPEIVGPEDYKGLPRPDEVPDRTGEIQDTGLFGGVITRSYLWDATYDAESYLRVLNTYSGHRSLPADTRERLFRGIASLIDSEYGGRIVKGYLTTLYVAPRK